MKLWMNDVPKCKNSFSNIKCGKANWEKLVMEPHEMSMEVDGWMLWNWWNIVYGKRGWNWWKMFMQMGMDEMFIIYKWMNEKMHVWMDGLMIWVKKLI